MKFTSLCFFLLLFLAYSYAQENVANEYKYLGRIGYNSNSQFGTCGTNYTHPDKYELQTNQYYIFTGDELEDSVDVETKTLILNPSSQEWVKKPCEKNGLGKSDSLWCFVEIPAITEEITILLDTTQSENFVIMEIEEQVLYSEGGKEEWIEIHCNRQTDKKLIKYLQNALGLKKYYFGEVNGIYSQETREAFEDYQRDYDFPIGIFGVNCLIELGVIHRS